MIVYQLCAIGSYQSFASKGKFFSQKVFRSKEKAEKYIPEFKTKVTGDRIDDLVNDEMLKVVVVELELED